MTAESVSQRRCYSTRASAPSFTEGRVGAPPLTHLRGNAAIVSGRNAALRLKNGSCEDDEPSHIYESRYRAPLPKKMILLSMILSKFSTCHAVVALRVG